MNNQEIQGTTNQADKGLGEMRCSCGAVLLRVKEKIDTLLEIAERQKQKLQREIDIRDSGIGVEPYYESWKREIVRIDVLQEIQKEMQ